MQWLIKEKRAAETVPFGSVGKPGQARARIDSKAHASRMEWHLSCTMSYFLCQLSTDSLFLLYAMRKHIHIAADLKFI